MISGMNCACLYCGLLFESMEGRIQVCPPLILVLSDVVSLKPPQPVF